MFPPRCFQVLRYSSLAAMVAIPLLVGSCGHDASLPTAARGRNALMTWSGSPNLQIAIRAQEGLSSELLAIPGVVGVASALDKAGRPLVMVYLERSGVAGIPAAFLGASLRTEVTGAFRAFAITGTYRPVPIGVSAGNAKECLPGTIGCVLEIRNVKYLLSANHVFARQDLAAIGEAIVQPSLPDLDPACGPAPADAAVGSLADFEPVIYDGKTPNPMDAAIARVIGRVECSTPAGFYGSPSATIAAPEVGLPVMKVGRTTELTRATLKAVNAKVKVTFPSGTALFVNQVITSNGFGDFGDSGSLVVADDGTRRPVGMLIGGSNNGSGIVTPISVILSRFGASVCGD